MATIMEKDVLIELVASILALISRKTALQDLANNADRARLLEIRKFLYSSFPHEVDYGKFLCECKGIKRKYQN